MVATGVGKSSAGRIGLRRVRVALAIMILGGGCFMEPLAEAQGSSGDVGSRSLPVTTRELVEISGLSALAVSPDGKHVAVLEDRQDVSVNGTRLTWRIITLAGVELGHADAGAPFWNRSGGLSTEAPQWSSDGRWLYFRAIVDQQVQVWRMRRDGGRTEQVTRDKSDVEAFALEPDGALHLAIAGATRDEIDAAENEDYDAGVLFSSSLLPGHALVRNFPVNGRMRTYRGFNPPSRDRGTLLAERPLRVVTLARAGQASQQGEAAEARLVAPWASGSGKYYVAASGRFRRPNEARPEGPDYRQSIDGGRTASLSRAGAKSDDAGDTRSGFVLSWRGGATGLETRCEAVVCKDADMLALVGWRANGRELVFQTFTFGVEAIHVWDTETNTVRQIIVSQGVFGASSSGRMGVCELATSDIVCIAASADRPPRLVAIRLDTGQQRVLLNPNPTLTPDRLGVARKIELRDRFGSRAYGWAILPHRSPGKPGSDGRRPLVITSYGCSGFLLGGSGQDVPEHVLTGFGYAAICIDSTIGAIRRPPDFPPRQQQAIDDSMVDTFEHAVRVLDEEGTIDPARVALTGMSASATGTLHALTRSNMFATGIITTQGYNDIATCYSRAASGECRRLAQREGFDLPYDARESNLHFAALSPAWRVEKITRPLLMQLAEVEHRDMLQLFSAMADYGRAVEMYVYPDEYHLKRQPRHRLAIYDRNIDWIAFWLRGDRLSMRTDDAGYLRWRAMRSEQCKLFSGSSAQADPPWFCGNQAGRFDN